MKPLFLLLILLTASARSSWSEAPKASILFTEEQRLNDPETGKPKTQFVDFGTVTDITFDPRESWVLDLELSSGQTRYLVFYEYDAKSRGTEFAVAPERAKLFKKIMAETAGELQFVQSGTFADLIAMLGRGSFDEYHGDETGRLYIPAYDLHIKNARTNSWISVDDSIETVLQADAAKAKAAAAARPRQSWSLLDALSRLAP